MEFNYNDGGRSKFFKGDTGDCVCRSIAIVTGRSYKEIYEKLAEGNAAQRRSKRQKKKRAKTAARGISVKRKWFKDYMKELGFRWVACMKVGTGCKVHLKKEELPYGRLVCSLSKHYTAVINGVINDTYDPSRGETRCVYGYWLYEGEVYEGIPDDEPEQNEPSEELSSPSKKILKRVEVELRARSVNVTILWDYFDDSHKVYNNKDIGHDPDDFHVADNVKEVEQCIEQLKETLD